VDLDLRWRSDSRGEVARFVLSEVQSQASITQLLCASRLLTDASTLLLAPTDVNTDANDFSLPPAAQPRGASEVLARFSEIQSGASIR